MRDFEAALQEYDYDLAAGNRAVSTRVFYGRTLRAWADGIAMFSPSERPETLANVRKEHITRWLASRAETEAPGTVLTRFRHLRAFFLWAEREQIVPRTPMLGMHQPSVAVQPPPVLTSEQLKAIFDTTHKACHVGTPLQRFRATRDYALLLLLADSGMRVGELCGLAVTDVDYTASTCVVLGKGRRRRTVAFSPRTGKALLAYLRGRSRHRLADVTDKVFIGQRGGLAEVAVWQIVQRRGEAAGVTHVFPHLFRHTMAHRFRLHGGQEGDLASLGGWTDRNMLARYGASAATERAVVAHRRTDHLAGT